jgi:3-hydroxyisobutyrate dehydrogenase
VVAQHRDLLKVLASPCPLRHVGGYGAGYTAKLLVNLLWFGQAVGTAEALLLGRAAGLDLGLLQDVLADSAPARDSSIMICRPCSPATSCARSAWTAVTKNSRS